MNYSEVRARILDTARFSPLLACNVATAGVVNAAAAVGDCNNNGVLDATDIANQTSNDCNTNEIPDECDYDCDGNGIPEFCEVGLIRPCCIENWYCLLCENLTPCECMARGGNYGPLGESCHTFDCMQGPDQGEFR